MVKSAKAVSILGICLILVTLISGWYIGNDNTSSAPKTLSATNIGVAYPLQFDAIQNKTEVTGLVAHALGVIDGEPYTNSLEAFNESYAMGFRLFEVDFMPLKDGDAITAHDLHESNFGISGVFSDYTKQQLKDKKYNGKYTPLFSQEFIELVRDYPDIQVVLDTKTNHEQIIRALVSAAQNDTNVLDRLIPHVSNQQNFDAVMAEYRFPQTMLALYRLLPLQQMSQEEIVAYIKKNDITAVMMNIKEDDATLATIGNAGRGKFSFDTFHDRLNQEEIPHYVHTAKTAKDVVKFREKGVGVYSDGIWLQ